MKKANYYITLAAAAFCALLPIAAGALVNSAKVNSPRYSLVMDYHGEAFTIDHGLSGDDCAELRPMDQWTKAMAFTCEREG